MPVVVSSRNALEEIRSKEMATTISSRLGRTSAVADEGEKRSRCPSKRRGRRPSLRSNAGPEVDVIPKSLISSVDDEDQSDEEEALLFSKDRSSNSKSSNHGTDRRGAKHVKSPDDRQSIRKSRSADGKLQSPQAAAPSKLRGSGNRRSLSTDEIKSPNSRTHTSPKKDGFSKRASQSTSPSAESSRRGVRTSHAGSDEAKGRASRHNRSGKANPPQKLKTVTKLDDSDSDDDGMPLSYLGGIHKQQGHLNSGLDDDVDFASDYSSATEDEASGRDDEDGAHRQRRKRGSSRRQRRASHSGGVRQPSIQKMLPTDDSECANDDDEETKLEKQERRKKTHSSSKESPNKRAGRTKAGRPDALQFSPSNRRASCSGEISQSRRHNSMLPSADYTETEIDETENVGDDEQNNLGSNRRHRTRLSMDVLRADILHKQRTESEGKKPTVDDKRIEADMAHAMQRLEAHDAEASKKKKKRFGQLMGMFKKSDTSESGYESTASSSSARDPNRGLARHRSRLVKNVLPHTLLNDSDSERQEADLFLVTK